MDGGSWGKGSKAQHIEHQDFICSSIAYFWALRQKSLRTSTQFWDVFIALTFCLALGISWNQEMKYVRQSWKGPSKSFGPQVSTLGLEGLRWFPENLLKVYNASELLLIYFTCWNTLWNSYCRKSSIAKTTLKTIYPYIYNHIYLYRYRAKGTIIDTSLAWFLGCVSSLLHLLWNLRQATKELFHL